MGQPQLVKSDWFLVQNITSGFKTALMGKYSEAVISALGRLRQSDCKFEVSLEFIVISCIKSQLAG